MRQVHETSAFMSPDSPEDDRQSEDLRTSVRHVLPSGVSASIRLTTGRTVYVTVRDLSRSGACVIRRGDLDIEKEEEVLLMVSDEESQQKVSLPSRVQWVDTGGYNTVMGLSFSQGPLLPGSLLDEFLDQSLKAPPSQGA
jgi:hypothetical protein